jgi:hypothetical protein
MWQYFVGALGNLLSIQTPVKISGLVVNATIEVVNPINPDLDLITMKLFLVKAVELGNPTLGAEAYVLYTVSKL